MDFLVEARAGGPPHPYSSSRKAPVLMAFASYVTRAAVAGLLASGAGGYLLVGGLPPSLGDLAGRAEPAVDDAARAGSQAAGAARQGAEAAVDARDRAQGAGRAGIDQAQAGVDAGQSAGESLLGAIVHWSLVVLAVVAVLSVVMACTRLWARSRRRPLRYEIRVPRADRPDFARLERVIQGLHRTLQAEKGITRVLFGQDHVALEMHLVPQEGDEHRHVGNLARAFIVCRLLWSRGSMVRCRMRTRTPGWATTSRGRLSRRRM